MRILVACEWSGAVRDRLVKMGHDAWSCDTEHGEGEFPDRHRQCKVEKLLGEQWDMMIAFPPCTHLASSGARWFAQKRADGRQQKAIYFFKYLWTAGIPRIAIENPVGIMSTVLKTPDQIVQPWQFGDPYEKRSCLWLRNLPPLEPTNVVEPEPRHRTKSGRTLPPWYNIPPTVKDRAKIRGKTFPGLADAMAQQWGSLDPLEESV
jgi:hypothetical protein